MVMSAGTAAGDAIEHVGRLREAAPRGFVFTKLDEASSSGAIFNVVRRSGLPAAYLSTGHAVPEDIEPASARLIVSRLLTEDGDPNGSRCG
jgi:flagellar biosynthesis protein FlhF